jgi:hypothetical protein
MLRHEAENVVLPNETGQFDAVRIDYAETVSHPRAGETVYNVLGRYAIAKSPGSRREWELIAAEAWADPEAISSLATWRWADLEAMRTLAGLGELLSRHMELVEEELYAHKRTTNAENRLIVSDQDELQALLLEYGVDIETWDSTGLEDLYEDIKPSDDKTAENISLHDIGGRLCLATAQSILNVYLKRDGTIRKLRETWKTRYDRMGNQLKPVKSTIHSSIGETGHLIHGRPEAPFATALRGLWEELGITQPGIRQLRSTGSALRQREHHYRFPGLQAEDSTHYFSVLLNPAAARERYVNEEKDSRGRLYEVVELEWSIHEGAT